MPGGIQVEDRTILIAGVVRHYLLVQPTSRPSDDVPLIVDLHGSGFDPHDQLRVSRSCAFAQQGAVVVAPQGLIPYTLVTGWPLGWAWNVPGSPLPGEEVPRDEPDDVGFLTELLDTLLAHEPVERTNVHVIGHSGGARLASHLPAALPWIASISCVAGLRYPIELSDNTVAITAVHGRDDTINPYDGGAGARWSDSVEECAARWAIASGCRPVPTTTDLGAGAVEQRHELGRSGAEVRLVAVPGVGHAWPGTADPGHQSRFGGAGSFDATEYLAHRIFGPRASEQTSNASDRPVEANTRAGR